MKTLKIVVAVICIVIILLSAGFLAGFWLGKIKGTEQGSVKLEALSKSLSQAPFSIAGVVQKRVDRVLTIKSRGGEVMDMAIADNARVISSKLNGASTEVLFQSIKAGDSVIIGARILGDGTLQGMFVNISSTTINTNN